MKVNRRLLYGGVFLVAAGGVTLVAQGDAVSDDALAQALRLWPFVLIALGAGLLLRRTRFGLAGGLVAAAMPGLLFGGLLVGVPRLMPECADVQPGSMVTRQGTFDGAAAVDLRLACGDLSVTTAPGSGWQLQTGDATGPATTVDVSPDRLFVTSSSQGHAYSPVRGGDVWRLSLPIANTLDLAAEVNAGRGRFDMAGARLGNVLLAVNAGDARVDLSRATVGHLSMNVNAASAVLLLPATRDFVAAFSVNAGSLRICAASGVGLRIRDTTVLASTHYAGLVRDGDAWESPGYSIANHHADVTISATLASVDINPQGGC